MNKFTFFIFIFLFSFKVIASPGQISVSGRIVDSANVPVTAANVIFYLKVLSPRPLTGSNSQFCVLYSEQIGAKNMADSDGFFEIALGTGVRNFPVTGLMNVLDFFNNNSKAFSCESGGFYVPTSTDSRLLRISFDDGDGVLQDFSPDIVFSSVPYAGYANSADKLGANVASDFLLKAGLPICGASNFLTWDGSAFICGSVTQGPNGTVPNILSNNPYLSVANGTNSTTLVVNVGTTPGTLASGDDSRFAKALQMGAPASGDLSGTYPAPTVAKIAGTSLSISSLNLNQYLKYDGTNWINSAISSGDVSGLAATVSSMTSSKLDMSQMPSNCALGQTLAFSSPSGLWVCSNISIGWDQIYVGKPTSLSGYGIADGLQNLGGSPGIQTGLDASKPTSPIAGTIYFATDSKSIYQFNSSAWVLLAKSAGAGGGGAAITGIAPITVATGGTAPIVSVEPASINNPGVVTLAASGGTAASTVIQATDIRLSDSRTPMGAAGGDLNGPYPAPRVGRLQGTPVSSISPTAMGQVLSYIGNQWAPNFIGLKDLRSNVTGNSQFAIPCGAGQTLAYNSVEDTMSCTNISISIAQVAGLGTAATLDVGSGPNKIVQLSADASLNVHNGAIVSDSVNSTGNFIDFSKGNVQVSSTSVTSINICGLKDGGTYTLILTGIQTASDVTISAFPTFEGPGVCSGVPIKVDLGADSAIFTSAGMTNILSFVYIAGQGPSGVVYGVPATNYSN